MMQDFVAVVIPLFNEACLESIIRMCFPRLEMVGLDRASDGNTVEAPSKYHVMLLGTSNLRQSGGLGTVMPGGFGFRTDRLAEEN